jgi:hypothetical protein
MHHPGYHFYIILADTRQPGEDYGWVSPCEILPVDAMNAFDLEDLSARFHVIEFCTALKPGAFRYFFNRFAEVEHILYLDPDLFFYGTIHEAEKYLEDGAAILLTPHILTPVPLDGKQPDETLFLNFGIYNLGFLGLKRSTMVLHQFLPWWEERVLAFGYDDVAKGRFTDQLWINLVPVFFRGIIIIQHPGYNMAPWNLHERVLDIHTTPGKPVLRNGQPLVFYHFSRYRFSDGHDEITYYNRYALSDLPALLGLYHHYKNLLLTNGHAHWKDMPCSYGRPAVHLPIHRAKGKKKKGGWARVKHTIKWALQSPS